MGLRPDTPSASLAEVSGGIIPDSKVPNQADTTYDGLGRPILMDSRRNNVTRSQTATVYDQAVSDTATSDGDGTITVPLNAAGQPFAGAPATETVTDALGRTIQLLQYATLPTVTVTSSQATPSSPYTTTVTASGGTTQATDYGFNAVGDQATVTDEATASGTAQAWTSTYNMLGQVTSRQDPDSGQASGMTYDADGNLLQSTSSLGKTLSWTYDPLDRKTAEFDAATSAQADGNELASWAYDNSNGAVASMANPDGHLTTATSYAGGKSGSAYTEQAGGFSVFGEQTSETVTIPSAEGALAGAYKEAHTYEAITGLPLKDSYQANGDAARRERDHRVRLRRRRLPPHRPDRHRRVRREHHLDRLEPARDQRDRQRRRDGEPHQHLRRPHRRADRRQREEHRRRVGHARRHVLRLRRGREPDQPDRDPQRRHQRDAVLRLRHPGPAQASLDRDRQLRRRPLRQLRVHRRGRDLRGRVLDILDVLPAGPADHRDRPRPERHRQHHHPVPLQRQQPEPARHADQHRQHRRGTRIVVLQLRRGRGRHQPQRHHRHPRRRPSS